MRGELAGIVSAISAINGVCDTLRSGKANADDVARLIGKFGTQQQKLDEFERKQKLKKPLTPQQAIQLSLARRNAANLQRQLKDLCLMAGAPEIWRDAERSLRESERAQAEFLKNITAKRRARQQRIKGVSIGIFLFVSFVLIVVGSYTVYQGFQKAQRDALQTRAEKRRDELRNIRKWGRTKC